VDHSPHRLNGHELNICVTDNQGIVDMCEVIGSDTEAVSCAIEVRDLAPDITKHTLSLFFENRKRSGGGQIEDMTFSAEEHRAIITFASPEGCIVPLLCYLAPDTSGTGYCFRSIYLFLCQQDYEKTAGHICMKFSGKVWSDHGTT